MLQKGVERKLRVSLRSPHRLIPVHIQGRPPPYFILGGLVFTQVVPGPPHPLGYDHQHRAHMYEDAWLRLPLQKCPQKWHNMQDIAAQESSSRIADQSQAAKGTVMAAKSEVYSLTDVS